MKNNQKGFGAIEALLILILLSILGFTGYYVYHSRNNVNSTYKAANSVNSTTSPSADWQTYDGKISDEAQNPALQADQIAYTLKYPADWHFYPIGTESTTNGQTGSNNFQEIAPSLDSNKSIAFNGISTSKSAEDYSTDITPDQSGFVGPIWQGVGGFSTKAGYSGYTSKLESSTGTVYETYVSNNKTGLIDFHYGAAMASDTTLQRIFDSVNIP